MTRRLRDKIAELENRLADNEEICNLQAATMQAQAKQIEELEAFINKFPAIELQPGTATGLLNILDEAEQSQNTRAVLLHKADYVFGESHPIGTAVVYTTREIILEEMKKRYPDRTDDDEMVNEFCQVHWAVHPEDTALIGVPQTADECEAWLRERCSTVVTKIESWMPQDVACVKCYVNESDEEGLYDPVNIQCVHPSMPTALQMAVAAVQLADILDKVEKELAKDPDTAEEDS